MGGGVGPINFGQPPQGQLPVPGVTDVTDEWGPNSPGMQPALGPEEQKPPQTPQPGRTEETYPSTPLQPWDSLSEWQRRMAIRGINRAAEKGEDPNALAWQFYMQYGIDYQDAVKEFEEAPPEE
jgi:hypothetical protein